MGILDFFLHPEAETIVDWAPKGAMIPVRCWVCGAIFMTKNEKYLGYSPILYSKYTTAQCWACDHLRHQLKRKHPDKLFYRNIVMKDEEIHPDFRK